MPERDGPAFGAVGRPLPAAVGAAVAQAGSHPRQRLDVAAALHISGDPAHNGMNHRDTESTEKTPKQASIQPIFFSMPSVSLLLVFFLFEIRVAQQNKHLTAHRRVQVEIV